MGHQGIARPKIVYNEKNDLEITDKKEITKMCGNGELRVRHLTSKECWRLMDLCQRTKDNGENEPCDFDDTPYERARAVCSESQLYKQAGNSICVGVLEELFETMFYGSESKQMTLD